MPMQSMARCFRYLRAKRPPTNLLGLSLRKRQEHSHRLGLPNRRLHPESLLTVGILNSLSILISVAAHGTSPSHITITPCPTMATFGAGSYGGQRTLTTRYRQLMFMSVLTR